MDRLQPISEASLGGGKAALGFEQVRIGTLVSMATDSSHCVIMGKILSAGSSAFIFYWIFFILAGIQDIYNISDDFGKLHDSIKDCGVSCP